MKQTTKLALIDKLFLTFAKINLKKGQKLQPTVFFDFVRNTHTDATVKVLIDTITGDFELLQGDRMRNSIDFALEIISESEGIDFYDAQYRINDTIDGRMNTLALMVISKILI